MALASVVEAAVTQTTVSGDAGSSGSASGTMLVVVIISK